MLSFFDEWIIVKRQLLAKDAIVLIMKKYNHFKNNELRTWETNNKSFLCVLNIDNICILSATVTFEWFMSIRMLFWGLLFIFSWFSSLKYIVSITSGTIKRLEADYIYNIVDMMKIANDTSWKFIREIR